MEALGQLIHTLEQHPRWRTQSQFRHITAIWTEVVGQNVARQSEPVKLSRGVLYVAVSNPTWAQTLTFERLRILEKLNCRSTVSLKEIRFSPGDWWRRSPQRQPPVDLQALQSHPCYWPDKGSKGRVVHTTAEAAFQGWAQHHQRLAAQQPRCPECDCPCPVGELQRWQKCSICAAKHMGASSRI